MLHPLICGTVPGQNTSGYLVGILRRIGVLARAERADQSVANTDWRELSALEELDFRVAHWAVHEERAMIVAVADYCDGIGCVGNLDADIFNRSTAENGQVMARVAVRATYFRSKSDPTSSMGTRMLILILFRSPWKGQPMQRP